MEITNIDTVNETALRGTERNMFLSLEKRKCNLRSMEQYWSIGEENGRLLAIGYFLISFGL